MFYSYCCIPYIYLSLYILYIIASKASSPIGSMSRIFSNYVISGRASCHKINVVNVSKYTPNAIFRNANINAQRANVHNLSKVAYVQP